MDWENWRFHHISAFILIGLFIISPGHCMHLDFPYNYHNFTEICEYSVIVIRGIRRDSYQKPFSFYPITLHQITILEMIKGEKPAHVISVSQTGGCWMGKFVESENYPLFSKGDELILFLRVVENDGAPVEV